MLQLDQTHSNDHLYVKYYLKEEEQHLYLSLFTQSKQEHHKEKKIMEEKENI